MYRLVTDTKGRKDDLPRNLWPEPSPTPPVSLDEVESERERDDGDSLSLGLSKLGIRKASSSSLESGKSSSLPLMDEMVGLGKREGPAAEEDAVRSGPAADVQCKVDATDGLPDAVASRSDFHAPRGTGGPRTSVKSASGRNCQRSQNK